MNSEALIEPCRTFDLILDDVTPIEIQVIFGGIKIEPLKEIRVRLYI